MGQGWGSSSFSGFPLLYCMFHVTSVNRLIPLSNRKLIKTAITVHAINSGTDMNNCARFISPPIPKAHCESISPIIIARQPNPVADASPLNKKGFSWG